MRVPSAPELLAIWEEHAGAPWAERALTLLAAGCDRPPGDLAGLSIGRRDALLMELRRAVFGERVLGTARCPDCDQLAELEFELGDVRVRESAAAEAVPMETDGYTLTARPPCSTDLLALADVEEAGELGRRLRERCLGDPRRGGRPVSLTEVPPHVVAAACERIDALDPQADVVLLLECPACERAFDAVFDIAELLWQEVTIWARRLVGEVHLLASSYGWREADILDMSPRRRGAYVAMAGG